MGNSSSSADLSIINSVLQSSVSNSLSNITTTSSNTENIVQVQTITFNHIDGCNIDVFQNAKATGNFVTHVTTKQATKIASDIKSSADSSGKSIQKLVVGMLGGIGRSDDQNINESVNNSISQIVDNTVTSETLNNILNSVSISQTQDLTFNNVTCRPGQKIDIDQNGAISIVATSIVNNLVDTAIKSKEFSRLKSVLSSSQSIAEKGLGSLLSGLFKLLLAAAVLAVVVGLGLIMYKATAKAGDKAPELNKSLVDLEMVSLGPNATVEERQQAGRNAVKNQLALKAGTKNIDSKTNYMFWIFAFCLVALGVIGIILGVREYKKNKDIQDKLPPWQKLSVAGINEMNTKLCDLKPGDTLEYWSCTEGGDSPHQEDNPVDGPFECIAAANEAIRENKCNKASANMYWCYDQWKNDKGDANQEYWGFEKNPEYDWATGKTQVPYMTGKCVKKDNAAEAPFMCKAACEAVQRQNGVQNYWGCAFDDTTGLFVEPGKCIQYPSLTVKKSYGGKEHVFFAPYATKAECESSQCHNIYACNVNEEGLNIGKKGDNDRCKVYLPQQRTMLESLGITTSFSSLKQCVDNAMCPQAWGCGTTGTDSTGAKTRGCIQYPVLPTGLSQVDSVIPQTWQTEEECKSNNDGGACVLAKKS